jgi:hypothetical protein
MENNRPNINPQRKAILRTTWFANVTSNISLCEENG